MWYVWDMDMNMNVYLQCILPFEKVAVMGLGNVCVLFSEVT